ncbi:type III-A CRISPR-associated protein Cas10/Csm1 [Streptococcus thermophilus]|nr:type III-A CRISPR-associated protein Cas10/Csm1 [Streptococcus thermophilus]MCE2327929.1 type III-A CRISPR-associated protein Cas10/Csm1 [Streptococcus thermophilus]MCE2332708.1 type III-A CRISPR-associated protein Cas10/Csm1 [Streptococcus thermophilus]
MKKEKIDLFYGALLHDIGKVIQRATGERKKHALVGADWFDEIADNQVISDQIRYHMANYQSNKLGNDHLAYITYIADNIASGVDRRQSNEESDEDASAKIWDTYTNQADIFNVFGAQTDKRYFKPTVLNLKSKPNFASATYEPFSKGDYATIATRIKNELAEFEFNQAQIDSLLNLFEATLSFVPSSTNTKEIADISLAEHSRLTAAFALAIYDYLEDKGHHNYKEDLFTKASAFYEEEAFLLASFDLSGIQDFIYNIATNGAAKQLKARSLYLDFMSEYIVDSLLDKLGLNRANLLYVGGGHAYFVLANTEKTVETLVQFEKDFNQFLLANFQTRLYVAFGWGSFAAKDIMSELNSPESYRQVYQKASRMISEKKISRYDYQTLMLLNRGGKSSERECEICHSVENLVSYHDQKVCDICRGLYQFSKEIAHDHFIITENEGLPIGPNACLKGVAFEKLSQEAFSRVYVKNDYKAGTVKVTHVFVGDYQCDEIYNYAALSKNENGLGIKRLAVVRLDVDDLGAAFMAGFSQQGNGQYSTLSRSATFSRSMSLFFKVYINQFASDKKLSIIYAGGDDVFAIGSWQDIIAFTVELRENFIKWTNGKLTLSAGIGLFADKTPIRLMAHQTGELEEAAKGNEKDSISLFSSDYTFKFDRFITNVYDDKLEQIRYFFNHQDERGKNFIYKLIELLRNYESEEKMNVARLAYYLTRLEELTDKDERDKFKQFKKLFFKWYTNNESDRKEAELALLLYVYEIRKD